MRCISHLIDDTSPGGITRFLSYIRCSPEMAEVGTHDLVQSNAGFSAPPRLETDLIISHIVLSWRNLPFFLALRARYPRTPIIHVEHHYSPAFVRSKVAREGRFNALLHVTTSLFDRIVTISTAQRDWLMNDVGLDAARLTIIPPCVDLTRFLEVDLVRGPIQKIGAIGRLDPQKGFDLLIPAFRAAALDGVELHIFGDGPDRTKLEDLAKGGRSIVFHGHVPDPVLAMASVDAIAMPSRHEPYGLVALEALAAGRPLLVSRADGLLDHAKSGALPVEDFTERAWTAALRDLASLKDTSCTTTNARANVTAAARRFASAWSELIEDLCPRT